MVVALVPYLFYHLCLSICVLPSLNNNPYGGAPGYFSLNNFPYDSFSQNLNFGSPQGTQNPSFNHQQTQAPPSQGSQCPGINQQQSHGGASQGDHNPSFNQHPLQPPSQSQGTPTCTRERRQWNNIDDLVLISGWLNTSKDVIVGNDQRSRIFWKRISDYYGASDHVVNGGEARLPDHCKQRWGRISKEVSHLCGAYAYAEGEKASGHNDVDVLKNAHQIYMTLYGKKFTLEHAWVELKHEQKWCSLGLMNPTSKTSSKKRKAEVAAPSSSSVGNEQETRAPGVKAMKARRFNGKEKEPATGEYPELWENKQKDMEAKKVLQMMSLLETLIAKTVPLDEDELALKKKLMAQLF
ncbi:glutathione S-transferase T3-like [Capsella rubella]|uniref:glutathione S-transferase T3-like n=1 Tax=Capsella rubella TaxID=81985 RepID=UPI000CD5331E|nr:glutathione S-transferase T3-like [Capsella rubella]